jgi:hypothetical protein
MDRCTGGGLQCRSLEQCLELLQPPPQSVAVGPARRVRRLAGDSLTIPRADTEAEAPAPIDEEPLTKLNLRTSELQL